MRLDPWSGAVEVDEASLRPAAVELFGNAVGNGLVSTVADYASAGVLVSEGLSGQAVLPWMSLEDTAYIMGGIPPTLRYTIGLGEAMDGEGAARLLRERYPGIAPDVFFPSTARLLLRAIPRRRFNDPEGPDVDPDPVEQPPRQRPAGGFTSVSGFPGPASNLYLDVGRCLLTGQWSGWWNGWTGWLPGWKLCLDYACADTLANFFLSFLSPGFTDIRSVYDVITAELEIRPATVQAAILSFFALALVGFLLGMNIKLVNGPNGACIWCSWPYTGGFYFRATGR